LRRAASTWAASAAKFASPGSGFSAAIAGHQLAAVGLAGLRRHRGERVQLVLGGEEGRMKVAAESDRGRPTGRPRSLQAA
jgi:cobalamin biosynthesis protein CobD/CbiB